MPAKMGRPIKEIDWKEFEQLCFLQCSLIEMCDWFHVTDKTLQRRVRENYGESFSEVFEKKRVGGLISLRRSLFKQAEHNVAAAIFLAKNLLGMRDSQVELNVDNRTQNVNNYPPEVAEAVDRTLKLLSELKMLPQGEVIEAKQAKHKKEPS